MKLHKNETLQEVNEHIRLIQKSDGLTFGTDAYLLAAYVRSEARATAVDLGSGTGIIPLLLLARHKVARCTAVELQPTFADLIERNAAVNGMVDRLSPLCADIRILTAAMLGGECDIVTANPPYMALGGGLQNMTNEKAIARHETAGGIRDFCAAAGRLLRHGGRFYCVFRPERLGDLMEGLRDAHLEPKRMTFVQATAAAVPSILLMEAVKYASPSLFMTSPLCLHEPDPTAPHKPALPLRDTADTAYVYSRCSFPDRFMKK